MENEVSGRIFNIQRCCTGDGQGIRTTIFFQGCPLHCLWCHNPESQSFLPMVSLRETSCINCGQCRKMEPDGRCRIMPERGCSGCGVCVKNCPGGALTLLGRSVSVNEVMSILLRDKFYFDHSGGGVTLSGGEPLAQPEFARELLKAAKAENIHTAIETSGAVPWKNFTAVLELCDLWLFDVKAAPERYRELTGGDYGEIKNNLLRLSESGKMVILRVPLVLDGNCEEAFFNELTVLAKLPCVAGVDILPYHDLGRGKSTMCGKAEPPWERFAAPDEEVLKRYRQCRLY